MLSFSEKFAAGWGIYLITTSFLFLSNSELIQRLIEMLSSKVMTILGGVLTILGFAHIYYHNFYEGGYVTVVTIMGYMVFTKGILLLFFPVVIDLSKDIVQSPLINYIIFAILFLGIYLVNAVYHFQDFSL